MQGWVIQIPSIPILVSVVSYPNTMYFRIKILLLVYIHDIHTLIFQKVVHFKNVSGVSRHLRVIPLESSHFSASLGTVALIVSARTIFIQPHNTCTCNS